MAVTGPVCLSLLFLDLNKHYIRKGTPPFSEHLTCIPHCMYIMCHPAVAQSVDYMPFNDEEPEARRSSTFPKVTKLVSSGVGMLTQVCQTPEAMLFTVQPASVTKSALRRFEGRGVIDGVRGE